MAPAPRGSILGSVLGIIVCGGIGGITAWAVVTALGWDGTLGGIAAAIIGMVIATAVWAAGTSLLRAPLDPMSPEHDIAAIAARLISAYDNATQVAPITAADPTFDVAAAYEVLREIEKRRRIVQGWQPIGRKIGFTNRTIWPRYGVYQPMWAHIWAHSVHFAKEAHATLGLKEFVQPRIEPEIVFKLKAPVPVTNDPLAVLACIEWIAPGFEVVQSHFPEWKFTAADCTAAFGLHAALVVGTPVSLTARNRAPIATALPTFTLTLRRGRTVIDRGVGANVLGSPALALVHLVRLLATQPQFPPLAAGEIITTGTLTDAWPVAPGETWVSDYGVLGFGGVTLTFQ